MMRPVAVTSFLEDMLPMSQRSDVRQQGVAVGCPARPWPVGAWLLAAGLAGCASPAVVPTTGAKPATPAATSATAATAAATPATAAGATAAPAPRPGQPPAFEVVIKDARKVTGPLTVWQKDDKFWLELAEADFGAPFFFAPKLVTGLGEGRLFGGLPGGTFSPFSGEQLVEFRRVHSQVQLLARNTEFSARDKTPEARAVQAAYSPSLLASTAVASQPHPERKSVLIEVNPLLLSDLPGIGAQLQRSFRQGYSFDGRNSAVLSARGRPDELVFQVQSHYASASVSLPSGAALPGVPAPSLPRSLPDVRSMFFTLQYSITRLPVQPMAPRRADGRLGHFLVTHTDYSDDLARNPRQRHIYRWRLEKQNPAAALSAPVKPITYWIDRSVPLKYRASITAGILEWNKAFEPIGFQGAIAVKVQPDDADWDTLDTQYASVRWMTNSGTSFGAIGPSQVDPRSGEILDADLALESISSRSLRTLRGQILNARSTPGAAGDPGLRDWAALLQARDLEREQGGHAAAGHDHDAACAHADFATEQLGYALDVLEARGDLDPDSPEVEAFVQAYIKDVTMHEVGHTLGLRHNFRASRIYSEAQLADPAFSAANALTGSVMEYAPVNLGLPGQPSPAPFQSTLGPYDYWAIEYAYKPIPADQEAAELARIAGRSGERELAYATDEDNLLGVDPEALQFDLGDDPVAHAAKRLAIARDLLQRLEQRVPQPGDTYANLRRSVAYALRDVARATGALVRQIGGVRTLRDQPGTGRDPIEPVPAAAQRASLALITQNLFSPQGLTVSPALQRRLAPDYLDRSDAFAYGDLQPGNDFTPQQLLSDLQRALLGQLMSDGVAQRLLDSQGRVSAPEQSLRLSELYRSLARDVWSELDARSEADIGPLRRDLQRDYTQRLTQQLLRPVGQGRADARTLWRLQAQELVTRLKATERRRGLSDEARAHLDDTLQALGDALGAKVVRGGV
jgi:Met-zincin/Domain of unknown function (DUF5117)